MIVRIADVGMPLSPTRPRFTLRSWLLCSRTSTCPGRPGSEAANVAVQDSVSSGRLRCLRMYVSGQQDQARPG